MSKKWRLSFNELRKWATGRVFYMGDSASYGHPFTTRHVFEEILHLIDKGTAIEFISNDDVGDISRACLEELALTNYAYDEEYGIEYFTDEYLKEMEDEQ